MPKSGEAGVTIRWWDHIGLWVGVIPMAALLGGVIFAAWYWPGKSGQRERYRQTPMQKYFDDYMAHDTTEAYRRRLLVGRIVGGVSGTALCLWFSTGVKKKKSP
jgi:hypothetical protein